MTHTETKILNCLQSKDREIFFQVGNSNSQILCRIAGARIREMINNRANLSSVSSALEASLSLKSPKPSANWPPSTCQEMLGCSHMPGRAAAGLVPDTQVLGAVFLHRANVTCTRRLS